MRSIIISTAYSCDTFEAACNLCTFADHSSLYIAIFRDIYAIIRRFMRSLNVDSLSVHTFPTFPIGSKEQFNGSNKRFERH